MVSCQMIFGYVFVCLILTGIILESQEDTCLDDDVCNCRVIPLSATGQCNGEYVCVDGMLLVGSDDKGLIAYNNPNAVPVTMETLDYFLLHDMTDRYPYIDGEFVCAEFTEMLHNSAEGQGIESGIIYVEFVDDDDAHVFNAFKTIDRGVVYVDNTAGDSIIKSFCVGQEISFEDDSYIDGTVSRIEQYW